MMLKQPRPFFRSSAVAGKKQLSGHTRLVSHAAHWTARLVFFIIVREFSLHTWSHQHYSSHYTKSQLLTLIDITKCPMSVLYCATPLLELHSYTICISNMATIATILTSLLFIAMIHTDCKLITLLIYLLFTLILILVKLQHILTTSSTSPTTDLCFIFAHL